MFLRPAEYYEKRFHEHQEKAWLAYKAGLDLFLDPGRRSGKSDFLAETAIEDIETNHHDCMFVAITRIEAREIMWSKIYDRVGLNPYWSKNESRLEWTHTKRGKTATYFLKGADKGAKSLRGGGKRLIQCDEFAFWDHPEVVEGELIAQLADFNGQIMYASTPKGKNHFYKLREKIKSDRGFYHGHWTMWENPYLNEAGKHKVKSLYLGDDDPYYRQEILGEYVNFHGLVFALNEDLYLDKRWDAAELDHSFHWRGLDHGFSPDPTACVWIAHNKRKGYFQVYSDYEELALLVNQHTDAILGQERWPCVDTIADVDPQLIAEYNALGFSMIPAGKYDKHSRLVRIVNALRTGRLKISRNCTKLLAQMQTYEWDQDGDDHLIDALNYGFTNLEIPFEAPEEIQEPTRLRNRETRHQEFDD